jgi:hypothetical protein
VEGEREYWRQYQNPPSDRMYTEIARRQRDFSDSGPVMKLFLPKKVESLSDSDDKPHLDK